MSRGTFGAEVEARLRLGDERYGDAWSERTVEELLGEAAEEAVDLAAWSALLVQRAVRADVGREAEIEELMVRASAAAGEAFAWLSAAAFALREERSA